MKQQQLPNWVSELTTSVLNVFQFEGGVRTHFAIIVKSGEDENNPDIQHIIIIHAKERIAFTFPVEEWVSEMEAKNLLRSDDCRVCAGYVPFVEVRGWWRKWKRSILLRVILGFPTPPMKTDFSCN